MPSANERRIMKTDKRKTKKNNAEQAMMIQGLDITKMVDKILEEQVKKMVLERIDKLIIAVIHNSESLGIWCPHRDDNLIRLSYDAKKLIRQEITRSFNQEVRRQVFEMSEGLKDSIKQRVDENMALFEVGQGNWVFRVMADQIKAHITKTISKTMKGLTIQSDPDAGDKG